MRKILYVLCCLAMIACGNEDTLESQIHFDDLYGIQDDPNDPVKHEIYNIYKEYGVPVYFNDTIGRIFLKTDVNGQPVYQIETLDLAWRYDYYEKSNYKYLYIKDADRQLEIISWIRNYLEASDKVLYPFCFFVTEAVQKEDLDNDEVSFIEDPYVLGFRTLTMVMENWEEGSEDTHLKEMKRSMVVQKINNYSNDLIDFKQVSDANWYGQKYWHELASDVSQYYNCSVLDPDYKGNLSGDALEAKRVEARGVAGRFGFVMGSDMFGNGLFTPWDTKEDVELYVKVMLATQEETFRKQWGAYPLVMQKYEVLYKIITEKLGVEL